MSMTLGLMPNMCFRNTASPSTLNSKLSDAVILAVAHKEFLDLNVKAFVKDNGVIYDVKGILPRDIIDGRL